jgi:ribose transport system permease protein
MPDIDFKQKLKDEPIWGISIFGTLLIIANIIAQPSFGAPSNWPEQLAAVAPLALVAMASTPAVISGRGGLDISIGPLAILINVVLVNKLLGQGVTSVWVCVPIVLALGALVGAINGFLVAVLRYQPVIATLCTFFVVTGLSLSMGAADTAAPSGNWTIDLASSVGPIPGALILMGVPAAIWLGLGRTAYVKNLYAVGGNDVTAFASGTNVVGTRILAYTLGGLIAAFAGIAITAYLQSSAGTGASQYTLIALAAVALGGTDFGGGRGGLLGSALAAFTIYLAQDLILALRVPPTWLQVVYGGLLVVGLGLAALKTKQRVGD